MALAEKLKAKQAQIRESLTKRSKAEAENEKEESPLNSFHWTLLFMLSILADFLFIILAVIGLIPLIGQLIYIIFEPTLDIIAASSFWLFLQYKGLGQYWWLAFGSGLFNLIPVINWFGWTLGVFILWVLITKVQKVPLAREALEKGAKLSSLKK